MLPKKQTKQKPTHIL